MNINIKKTMKKLKIVLIFLIIMQILTLFIVGLFIKYFEAQQEIVGIVIQIAIAILFIIIDIYFYKQKIYRLNGVLYIKPIECVIEDFIIYFDGKHDGKREYRIAPIIRAKNSNKLYFTYGKYSLSYYKSITSRMNRRLIEKTIVRDDWSKVQIGDPVLMYKKSDIFVETAIIDNNNVKLNNKTIRFSHINNQYDVGIFNKVTFFEGAVDVEVINKK